MQHGSADLRKSLPEAQVMIVKHVAGPVKTATMLPVLLYHHALALGPAFPKSEVMIKIMIRSAKLWYDMSQDRAMCIADQLMTCLTFTPGQCALMMHKLCSPDQTIYHNS